MIARRTFLAGIASAFAAPAIVRIQNIMPVKAMPSGDALDMLRYRMTLAYEELRRQMNWNLYGDDGSVPILEFAGYEIHYSSGVPDGEFVVVPVSHGVYWEPTR